MKDYLLQPLNFPDFSFRVRELGQSKQIYDSVRKRFVALTPEEWVRQNLLRYMSEVCRYPPALMAVEKLVKVNGLSQRADIVVYNRQGKPWLIAECKSTSVKLSQDTFLQAARYNFTLEVPFLVLTNGLEHYCLQRIRDNFEFLADLPEFMEL
ncbi:MAG: type I restriction enzyme HsdR N-terminal domain-containing protein [Bacteroidia bacterium]|nr:type I restriction enzyme HsdR N-terminal domain-containing protein [Bacteroidia bacterium]